jgi:hypothetical protein
MVPSAFVFLDRMPLTSNGLKVDRAALPSPVADARAYGPDVVAPRTETERRLAELWCEVLPVDRVGVHDNFMDLGGHSLLLIRVLDRIEREHGVRMLPGELVFPTLGQLAATLDERRTDPPAARPRGLLWRAFRRR